MKMVEMVGPRLYCTSALTCRSGQSRARDGNKMRKRSLARQAPILWSMPCPSSWGEGIHRKFDSITLPFSAKAGAKGLFRPFADDAIWRRKTEKDWHQRTNEVPSQRLGVVYDVRGFGRSSWGSWILLISFLFCLPSLDLSLSAVHYSLLVFPPPKLYPSEYIYRTTPRLFSFRLLPIFIFNIPSTLHTSTQFSLHLRNQLTFSHTLTPKHNPPHTRNGSRLRPG